jgi:hypothetical protein
MLTSSLRLRIFNKLVLSIGINKSLYKGGTHLYNSKDYLVRVKMESSIRLI